MEPQALQVKPQAISQNLAYPETSAEFPLPFFLREISTLAEMKYHVLQIAVLSRQNIDLPLNQADEPQSPSYENFLMLSPLRFIFVLAVRFSAAAANCSLNI